MKPTLVIASFNRGKVVELGDALAFLGCHVVSAEGFGGQTPQEDAGTFKGNARIKLEAMRAALPKEAVEAGDYWILADDSGLEVAALDGKPGVETAHFGGWPVLLDALKDVPQGQRQARFVCVLALAQGNGEAHFFEGACEGEIALEAQGDSGFGYDPVFIPAGGDGRTFAQMAPAEKDALSHRGQAVAALRDGWRTPAPEAPL